MRSIQKLRGREIEPPPTKRVGHRRRRPRIGQVVAGDGDGLCLRAYRLRLAGWKCGGGGRKGT